MEEQKERAAGEPGVSTETKKNLLFAVNGERFELPNADPSTTLLTFLRSHTLFKSPKLGCGEGTYKLVFTFYGVDSISCYN